MGKQELINVVKQTPILDLDVMYECPCRCHPRCKAYMRCNEAFHKLPFPPAHHNPGDKSYVN